MTSTDNIRIHLSVKFQNDRLNRVGTINVIMKRKQVFDYQIGNIGHSDIGTCVQIHDTEIHLCVRYEASRATGVATMDNL